MTIINIDGKQYESDTLSDEVKANIISIRVTDEKIIDLQKDLAIAQTARNAYARTLAGLLPEK